MSSLRWKTGSAALTAIALALCTSLASADTTQTFNKWVEDIKWTGDIRVRQENFDKRTTNQVDRSRQRFRLRLNTDVSLPYKLKVKFTFASGTGEQVSTNQSYDNLSSQKQLWIDKAYVVWSPSVFTLQTGRMVNPIWRTYTSDIVWDDDFNPEGFSESYSQLVGPFNIFANALQMVVDEDSGFNVSNGQEKQQADQWMFAWQLGTEFRLPLQSRAKIGFTYYDWVNERYGSLSQATTQEGNRRTAGNLTNEFNVREVTAQLSSWVRTIPVSFQGTWIENTSVQENNTNKPLANKGFQYGVTAGQAKEKNTFEAAYFYKHAETDSTVADIADSDFGDGGTNRKGHIMWVAYAPAEFLQFKVKYFDTHVIDEGIATDNRTPATGGDDIRRYQFDFNIKF